MQLQPRIIPSNSPFVETTRQQSLGKFRDCFLNGGLVKTQRQGTIIIAQLQPSRRWHLATAFFVELVPGLAFVTLDEQQETVARDLGVTMA